MTAIGHPHRQLARKLVKAAQGGTPLRHARAVVVSATIGQTVVTLDGGATNVPAFNYGHTQSLPAGTVVDVLAVGRKAYVLGAYGAVGVGGLVAYATGPASTAAFTTQAVAATATAPVVAGASYLISGRMLGSQITNPGGIAYGILTTDDTGIGVVAARFFDVSGVPVAASAGGGGTTLYTPSATRTTVFAAAVFSSAASFQLTANTAELIVTRCA